MLSCLSFDSSHFRNWQCHISRLYIFKSGVPVPLEDVAYDIGAKESRDMSKGVFKPELKLPDNLKNNKSVDKEGVMLEVLYMLLDDILGIVRFIGKVLPLRRQPH